MLAVPVLVVVVLAAVSARVVATEPVAAASGAPQPPATRHAFTVPGFVSATTYQGGTYARLYSGATTEAFSSPAVGDVTGDGVPDVVVGGMDGCVRVFAVGGTLTVPCLPVGTGAVQATPVLYDFDHDGVDDILTAAVGSTDVWVFHGRDFRVLWHTSTSRTWAGARGVFGTPAIGDLDHDGNPEIVVTSWDNHVYAWSYPTGRLLPGFPKWLYDTIFSSPVLVDLDHDGWLEIVTGADMDFYKGAPYPGGGLVWVLRHDGTVQPGWPASLPGQTIWSSPALVDLDGDGRLDVVVGSGLNFPEPAGRHAYALDGSGRNLPGWPVSTRGAVMASPAVANLAGIGPVVVVASEGGWVDAYTKTGALLWRQCAASVPDCNDFDNLPTHGGVSIADVNGDGSPDVVTALDKHVFVYDLRTGALEYAQVIDHDLPVQVFAPASTPTVASIGGQTHIFVSATFDANADGRRDVGDELRVYDFTTGQALGAAPWPTFKQNMCRSGTTYGCDSIPPSRATVSAPAPTSTRADVTWHATDQGFGVRGFDVDVSVDGGRYVRWFSDAPPAVGGANAWGAAPLFGLAGHTYTVRARAIDGAWNIGAFSVPVTFRFASTLRRAQPFTSGYSLTVSGELGTLDSAPLPGGWPATNARGIAVLASGVGGYGLDGNGAIHPFGTAPTVSPSALWPGWDIARGIALNRDGSGYVLDGFGGLHPFGGARPVSGSYWKGWDIARGIVLTASSTRSRPVGYVVDAFGGVHAFGAAGAVKASAYWRNWPIVRGLALDPDGPGGYVLDAFGGLHQFGGAPPLQAGAYWRGWDIARGIAMVRDTDHRHPGGYVVDGFGGVHAFGAAGPLTFSTYWGRDVVRGVALAP
jgi:hypothetical protein